MQWGTEAVSFAIVTWQPCWHLVSSVHSSVSRHIVPLGSVVKPRGQIHLKLPIVLIHVPGGGHKPGCSAHSLMSIIGQPKFALSSAWNKIFAYKRGTVSYYLSTDHWPHWIPSRKYICSCPGCLHIRAGIHDDLLRTRLYPYRWYRRQREYSRPDKCRWNYHPYFHTLAGRLVESANIHWCLKWVSMQEVIIKILRPKTA